MPGCAGQLLGASADCQAWTAAEDEAVRALYLKGGYKAVQRALPHRSASAIMHRAARFGLKTKRRWTRQDIVTLRNLWGSGVSLETIAQHLGRTPATTYWRAQHLGLDLGVPQGFDYLSLAARRLGFSTSQLRAICTWAEVPIKAALARPAKRRSRGGGQRFHHCVDSYDAELAVERWLKTECVEAAARDRKLKGETLSRWLRKSGLVKPVAGRKRWRVESAVIDRVAAEGRAGKFARWPQPTGAGA